MRIQHNINALNAHRQLGVNNTAVGKNLEKLSSGYRINRAGDDAAGLAISEKMRGQIRGLEMAGKNANDGISLIQTAEGALNETHSILQRMRELAVQSSNGTYEEGIDRVNLDKEVTALKSEIDRIASSTHFNNQKLLDGTLSAAGASDASLGATVTTEAIGPTAPVKGVKQKVELTLTALTEGQQLRIGNQTFVAYDSDNTPTGDLPTVANTTFMDVKAAADTAVEQAAIIAGKLTAGTMEGFGAAAQTGTTAVILVEAAATGAGKDIQIRGWDNAGAAITPVAKVLTGGTAVAGTDDVAFKAGSNATAKFSIDANKLKAGSTVTLAGQTFKILSQADYDKETTANKKNAIVEGTSNKDAADKMAKRINEVGTFADRIASVSATGEFSFEAAAVATTGAQLKTSIGASVSNAGLSTSKGVTFQIGANGGQDQQVNLAVENQDTTTLGIAGVTIGKQDDANSAIALIDSAVNKVSGTRADLGALQNRLEHTVANLGVSVENLTAAESRIRDVDMAKEMMEMTKNNILTQAAQAMLAQANTQPQGVLQLLQ